jgi:hypothetical protein
MGPCAQSQGSLEGLSPFRPREENQGVQTNLNDVLMVQEDALNQGLIDGRAVKTSQIREKMALIRFGNLRVLSGNRVIEENDVIVFAAAQGRFLLQQLEAADAAFRGGDVKSGHGRYSPLSLGKGDEGSSLGEVLE